MHGDIDYIYIHCIYTYITLFILYIIYMYITSRKQFTFHILAIMKLSPKVSNKNARNTP